VGAGIGRVTSTVLLHLVDDVVLLEPVKPFIQRAIALGRASETDEGVVVLPPTNDIYKLVSATPTVSGSTTWRETTMGAEVSGGEEAERVGDDDENKAREEEPKLPKWKGIKDKTKSVTFIQATLQGFDPLHAPPALTRIGYIPSVVQGFDGQEKQTTSPISEDIKQQLEEVGFDVIWCQWCLGHLSDVDLVAFLQRSHAALRENDYQEGRAGKPLIVVKENVCTEPEGVPLTVFDPEDSSLTRFVHPPSLLVPFLILISHFFLPSFFLLLLLVFSCFFVPFPCIHSLSLHLLLYSSSLSSSCHTCVV
jgi:hypothetical protein